MRNSCLVVMVGSLLTMPVASATAGTPKATPTQGPLKICVVAKAGPTSIPVEEMKAREAKMKETANALETFENETKKQFGKDRRKWPPDKQAAYYEALFANNMAWSEVTYAVPPEKDKTDTVENIRDAIPGFAKKGWIALVDEPAEADVVLEVVGRRGMGKLMRGDKYISCDLRPGKIGVEVLARIPVEWPFTFGSRGFTGLRPDHWFKADAPFFRFEVTDPERWRDVAGKVPWVLTDFAKDHYVILKPAP